MQAQQHNSSYSIVPKAKTADLMFPNIFSSIMAVKKQVTSTLQTIKQWKLYFSFLMVFTEREFFNSLSTLFRWEEGGSAKRFPASFPQRIWLLVSIFFPHSCKSSGAYLVPVSNYWTWTKTTPKKKSLLLVKSV